MGPDMKNISNPNYKKTDVLTYKLQLTKKASITDRTNDKVRKSSSLSHFYIIVRILK